MRCAIRDAGEYDREARKAIVNGIKRRRDIITHMPELGTTRGWLRMRVSRGAYTGGEADDLIGHWLQTVPPQRFCAKHWPALALMTDLLW